MEFQAAPICCPWLVPVLPLMKLSVTENFPVLLLRTLVRIVFWVDSATGNMNQSIFLAGRLLIGRSELENEDGSKETQLICFCSIKTFCSSLGSRRHIIDWSKCTYSKSCNSNIFCSHYLWSHHDNQPRWNCRNVLQKNSCYESICWDCTSVYFNLQRSKEYYGSIRSQTMYHVTIYVRGVMHTYREGNSDLVIWQGCFMWRSIIMSDHLYAKAGTLNIRFHARKTLTSYFQ